MSGRYLVLILIAVAACRRPARLDVDLSGLTEVVQRRVAHAAGEPRFDAAVAAVGAAIAADPAVAKAGAALFATLANDPELARSTEAIMAALQSSPRFQGALRDLQAAHLTAAQPELDALLGARIDANLASAAWRDAWTNGWRPFAARLDVGGVPPAPRRANQASKMRRVALLARAMASSQGTLSLGPSMVPPGPMIVRPRPVKKTPRALE